MICSKCNTNIPASFKHAIVNNKCPSCGHKILKSDKMEAFRALKTDLSRIELTMDKEESVERIVMFLIDNYVIRPALNRNDPSEDPDEEEDDEDDEGNEDDPDEDPEELIREQIYQEVEKERYGDDEDEEEPDADDRVARLKKKMKNGKKFLKKNVTIQKIGS